MWIPRWTVLGTLVVASLMALAAPGVAQDRLVPFQAALTDASGTDVPDGAYDVTFRLYDVPTGGTAEWTELHTAASGSAVTVVGGRVSVILGALSSFDDPDGDSDPSDSVSFAIAAGPKYLGVTIGGLGDAEMVPRHLLLPSFQARRADFADSSSSAALALAVVDASVDTSNIAADAVTAEKISAGAVGTSEIADQAVDETRLAVASVTETRLADTSVSEAKLAIAVANQLSKVGDIVYSMLDETDFQAQRGTNWVPMDGRGVVGSQYEAITGLQTVPNAQGRFLRVHDPLGTTNPAMTLVGGIENDQFASHRHAVWRSNGTGNSNNVPFRGASNEGPGVTGESEGSDSWRDDLSAFVGSSETRPKGLVVNAYIRID